VAAPRRPFLRRLVYRRGSEAESQADELCMLIMRKIEGAALPEGARDFVQSRFKERMQRHLEVAPWQARAFLLLSVVSIAGGVAASTLGASGESSSGWVVGLGLLIAAATAINQISKVGPHSATRFHVGNALRREGWDFVMDRGRYVGVTDVKARFAAFYDAVWAIERLADLTVETTEDTATK
jgi:hypothetical protein